MAQLSLRERLQPALLDRLIDDERLLTCYEFSFSRAELKNLGIPERDLVGILSAHRLRAVDGDDVAAATATASTAAAATSTAAAAPSDANTLRLRFTAPGGSVSVSQLKALTLKPPGKPQGVALQSFCEITARNIVNETVENGELRAVSMRRLREYVRRDLDALLNCANLDAVADLSAYPHVQASVINFGMPSLAGRMARSVDPQAISSTIELAIRRFEPRLSALRVTAEMSEDGKETHVLSFRIEAQLWGQPMPQQLVLRTSIDVDSGSVNVSDSGAS
jgi:type VI secretion system protein ImpF